MESPPSKRSTNYHLQFLPLTQEIYIYNGLTISHHLTTTMNRNRIVIIPDTEDYCNQLPTDSFLISQTEESNSYVIHHSHAYVPKYTPTIRTFDEFIKTKPDWIFKLINNYHKDVHTTQINNDKY